MSAPPVWNEAALALFRLERSAAVSAGAGAGKTTALVELCVRILSGETLGEPVDPAAIVAITFTERAGEELATRLRAELARRAREAPSREAARPWLDRLSGLDRMALGTIHTLAGRLLREHPLEAGVDPDFEVLDESAAGTLRAEAARAAVVAAADAGDPEVLRLCAGQRVAGRNGLAALVAELLRERATLGLTGPPEPAPDARDEAESARRRVLDAAQALLEAGRGIDKVLPLREAWAGISPEDREGPLTPDAVRRLFDLDGLVKHGPRTLQPLKKDLAAACEEFGALAREVLAGPQKRAMCALVAAAEARYRAAKAEHRGLDFDDLLLRCRDLLRRDRPLRRELKARTRAVLVDEYQDVNALQQELFFLLCEDEAEEGEGAVRLAPRKLVAVGDLKQAIYGFRGADVTVFAGIVERFGAGEGQVLHLAENHRSRPAVLDLVNDTFSRAFPAVPDPAQPWAVPFGPEDHLRPRRPPGSPLAGELLVDPETVSAAEGRAREAGALAARIQAIVSGAAGVVVLEKDEEGKEHPRRPRYADVALLFKRLTRVEVYEEALRVAGIPYKLARGGGFYQAPEVRDLGELLASLFDPEDAIAWAALLRSPFCAVTDAALLTLAAAGLSSLARRDEGELPEGLGAAERERLVRFLQAWRELAAHRDRLAVGDLLTRALDALDVEAVLLASPEGERRAVNARKAVALARRWEESGGDARGFAAHLRAMALAPPREPEAALEAGDAVAILSVHQAKGLEWPVVIVPDLGARPRNEGKRARIDRRGRVCVKLFDPASERWEDTAHSAAASDEEQARAAAESRRLLYVALTRARDWLVLSGSGVDGTWRSLIEPVADARPELLARYPLPEAATRAVGPPLPPEAGPAAVEPPPPAPPRLAPPPRTAAVRLAVTDLAEYARCPRRHWLGRHLGIPEREDLEATAAVGEGPGAQARGTLAHAMLAELDLAAPPIERRSQLIASALRRGQDPAGKPVRRIIADLTAFLDSPAGARLAAAQKREGGLLREVPFLLRLDGGPTRAYLTGAMDALVIDGGGKGGKGGPRGDVAVLDFKYASPRPGAAERYRFQLLAYALAAQRAMPRARVTAAVQFLRGSCTTVDITPSAAELARFEADAPRLAAGAFAGDGDQSPEALGRDEARCAAEGCGFTWRCYPKRASPRAEPALVDLGS